MSRDLEELPISLFILMKEQQYVVKQTSRIGHSYTNFRLENLRDNNCAFRQLTRNDHIGQKNFKPFF